MKSYNKEVFKLHLEELKGGVVKDVNDPIMGSDEFIEKFALHIKNLALNERDRKTGHLKARSTKYANIGCMNGSDLLQEAYYAFMLAYRNLDLNREDIVNAPEGERGAIIWGFLKLSTLKKLETRLRELKDGVRVPDREMFVRADSPNKKKEVNFDFFTKNFSQLDKMFGWVGVDEATSKHETDLMGLFLECQMDKYLDRTFKGEVNYKGIERDVIKKLYGIDCNEESYADLEKHYNKSKSTLTVVKARALSKLQSDECKLEIAEYAKQYHMRFGTWYDSHKKEMVTPGVYEWLDEYTETNRKKK